MFSIHKIPESLNKTRIDVVLKELNIVDSRNKAIALIMSGKVYIDDVKIDKPGKIIKSNTILKLRKKEHEWVSRGGIKLDNAIKKLEINVSNKTCLDIGCSTGGFSEVLIKRNVKKIYAVDVGYGQFDWKLRNTRNITLLERTNVKELDITMIPEKIDLVVCDVSFISLKKVMLPTKKFLANRFQILSLIKPQFEANRNEVSRGGIVRDEKIHRRVCEETDYWFRTNFEDISTRIFQSSIFGQKGNKEFFIYISN